MKNMIYKMIMNTTMRKIKMNMMIRNKNLNIHKIILLKENIQKAKFNQFNLKQIQIKINSHFIIM